MGPKESTMMQVEQNVFCYNENNITLKKENGNVYVNLTEIAKAFPEKNLSSIINSQEIRDYINRLSEIKNFSSIDLLKVTRGGDVSLQGTWAHQKVALRVCQKLSTDFAIMVDTKIEELLSQGYTTLDNINRKELARMILEQEEEKERLVEQNRLQERQLKQAAPKIEYFEKVKILFGSIKNNCTFVVLYILKGGEVRKLCGLFLCLLENIIRFHIPVSVVNAPTAFEVYSNGAMWSRFYIRPQQTL